MSMAEDGPNTNNLHPRDNLLALPPPCGALHARRRSCGGWSPPLQRSCSCRGKRRTASASSYGQGCFKVGPQRVSKCFGALGEMGGYVLPLIVLDGWSSGEWVPREFLNPENLFFMHNWQFFYGGGAFLEF